jgi:hypothetical protein
MSEGLDLGIEESPQVDEQMVSMSMVRRLIQEALAAQATDLAIDAEEAVAPGEPPPGFSGRKKRIIIEDVEGLPNFEVLGINGHVIKVKRGEEVEVWEEYVEVLKHAVSSFEPTLSDVEKGSRKVRNRNLIPWRLVG